MGARKLFVYFFNGIVPRQEYFSKIKTTKSQKREFFEQAV
jgi:hypothetical protein